MKTFRHNNKLCAQLEFNDLGLYAFVQNAVYADKIEANDSDADNPEETLKEALTTGDQYWASNLQDPNATQFILFDDSFDLQSPQSQKLVGTIATLMHENGQGATICSLHVMHDRRGNGASRDLYNVSLNYLVNETTVPSCFVDIAADNEVSKGSALKQGFNFLSSYQNTGGRTMNSYGLDLKNLRQLSPS